MPLGGVGIEKLVMKIIPYKPYLKEIAKKLRNNMTLAEVLLWTHLKQRKMLGYDFDRQRAIDLFIIDFFCKKLNLAIEIDGQSHNFNKAEDNNRQKRLEALGVHFLRFWDAEVKSNIKSVLKKIEEWIKEHEKIPTPPNGTPPKEGT